jgi:hypothetical protein
MSPAGCRCGGPSSKPESHDQAGQPLCKLWRKTRSCLPSPLGTALLPQILPGRFPCENRQGSCAHAKVVWPPASWDEVARSANQVSCHGGDHHSPQGEPNETYALVQCLRHILPVPSYRPREGVISPAIQRPRLSSNRAAIALRPPAAQSDQLQRLQAPVAILADDDVVVHRIPSGRATATIACVISTSARARAWDRGGNRAENPIWTGRIGTS